MKIQRDRDREIVLTGHQCGIKTGGSERQTETETETDRGTQT